MITDVVIHKSALLKRASDERIIAEFEELFGEKVTAEVRYERGICYLLNQETFEETNDELSNVFVSMIYNELERDV